MHDQNKIAILFEACQNLMDKVKRKEKKNIMIHL